MVNVRIFRRRIVHRLMSLSLYLRRGISERRREINRCYVPFLFLNNERT